MTPSLWLSNATPLSRIAPYRFIVSRLSSAVARTPRSYEATAQLRQNRNSQAKNSRSNRGLMYSGELELTIQRRDVRARPGIGNGPDIDGVIHPAFPLDAPAPGSAASSTTTS